MTRLFTITSIRASIVASRSPPKVPGMWGSMGMSSEMKVTPCRGSVTTWVEDSAGGMCTLGGWRGSPGASGPKCSSTRASRSSTAMSPTATTAMLPGTYHFS